MLQYRGAEKPRRPRSKPRALKATRPNEIFSWDITYLSTEVKGIYFYLYLSINIFSRKVVGWQVFENENSALIGEVMKDICAREKIFLKLSTVCVAARYSKVRCFFIHS